LVLRVEGFIRLDWVIDKIIAKHGVYPEEVEEAFFNSPYKVRRIEENKYLLFGRSEEGHYLSIVFVWEGHYIKTITARDMTDAERRFFGRK
jgi:uncharacterized DUF497 family protein